MNMIRVWPWQLSQYALLSACSHCLSGIRPLAAVVSFMKGAFPVYFSCSVAMAQTCASTLVTEKCISRKYTINENGLIVSSSASAYIMYVQYII